MNTQKAILAIDAVTAAIVNGVINTAFIDKLIYGKLDNELYKHVLNKWASKKGDVFDFYLNSNDDIKRWLLEALDVEVEPDKYPDYDSRITAQICEGKTVRRYILLRQKLYILFFSSDITIALMN